MERNIRIGLDVGIGSIGWAILSECSTTGNRRIEDLGVRIFVSGEENKGKDRLSQKRRLFRSTRRVLRRRYFRKDRLKRLIERLGIATVNDVAAYFEGKVSNVYDLRVRALDEKLTGVELASCLLHICNHRGYRDFYAGSNDSISEKDTKDQMNEIDQEEYSKNKKALEHFNTIFDRERYRTVAECIVKDEKFRDSGSQSLTIRNHDFDQEHRIMIDREFLIEEVSKILDCQCKHYKVLDFKNRELILDIIFSQRDFEDGPGNPEDKNRRYKGFLDTIGNCTYYKDLRRGSRGTVIADLFSIVNTLSQYAYINNNTGEIGLPKPVAQELINSAVANGLLSKKNIERILGDHDIQLKMTDLSDKDGLLKANRFMKAIKPRLESAGYEWAKMIDEDQWSEKPSKLHLLGECIAQYITPSRRKKELKKLDFVNDTLIEKIADIKIGGTSNVSYQFMRESINAFLNGETYGNFQAAMFKMQDADVDAISKQKKLEAISDQDIKDNPVVYRAINETRKVLNAIIQTYGSPVTINIEVASDLNRSFLERMKVMKAQKENEKEKAKKKTEILKLLEINEEDIDDSSLSRLLDKYTLYKQQDGKCLYSGLSLGTFKDVCQDRSHQFEVDHIVPYSLILDNTLHNKALVWGSENQAKRQRTPLMYLSGGRKEAYIGRVNTMLKSKGLISSKKYQYLMLESLYSEEAQDILRTWKSRNINDTRYITRYLVSYLNAYLEMNSKNEQAILGIKGALTSKFRRIWLRDTKWGAEEKDRLTSFMHHAVDAIVVANLTRDYIEIASDYMKLNQIRKTYKSNNTPYYQEYLENCKHKMKKYYGFDENYTEALLIAQKNVPSFIPNLKKELCLRLLDNKGELSKGIVAYYGNTAQFAVEPHCPLVSIKQEKRFRGQIADSNPIRLVEDEKGMKKIVRKAVGLLNSKDLKALRTNDLDLKKTLERILEDKPDKYTLETYWKEEGLSFFTTDRGQRVNKVSVEQGLVSNYYKKRVSEDNHTYLGGLKYYCIEVYRNAKGNMNIWGIRYVDIIKKDKKLCIIADRLPDDYGEHVMYLQAGDYVEIFNKKGGLKFSGYYKSVKSINQNAFRYIARNEPTKQDDSIALSQSDKIIKHHVDILGRMGGVVRCSEPFLLAEAKE